MLTEERYGQILARLEMYHTVTVPELEKMFGVSSETVRRDLLALEGQKKLIRVHGGAMSIRQPMQNKTFDVRQGEFLEEKQELARCAASFVNEGDTLVMDGGSTAVSLCRVLAERFRSLTVIVNSPMLLDILAHQPGFRLILCGGTYDATERSFIGPIAVRQLRELHANKAFVAPSGISLQNGLTIFSEGGIGIQQAMRDIADKVFVVADHSKFGMDALYRTMLLDGDMTLITDHCLDGEIYRSFLDADIDIVRGEKQKSTAKEE